MASIDLQCAICSASFRPGDLNEKGKCKECEKQYPSASNKLEAMALSQPELHLNEEMTEEVVRRIAKEEIHKYMSTVTNLSEKETKEGTPYIDKALKKTKAECLEMAREAKAKKGDKK